MGNGGGVAVVPAVYNPSNGTYSFISNIPGPGGVPLRTDFADSSEDGSNSEVGLACLHDCMKSLYHDHKVCYVSFLKRI